MPPHAIRILPSSALDIAIRIFRRRLSEPGHLGDTAHFHVSCSPFYADYALLLLLCFFVLSLRYYFLRRSARRTTPYKIALDSSSGITRSHPRTTDKLPSRATPCEDSHPRYEQVLALHFSTFAPNGCLGKRSPNASKPGSLAVSASLAPDYPPATSNCIHWSPDLEGTVWLLVPPLSIFVVVMESSTKTSRAARTVSYRVEHQPWSTETESDEAKMVPICAALDVDLK